MDNHQVLKDDLEGFKELWQFGYIKENNQRVFFVVLISALWYTLFIAPFYLLIKPSMPQSAAEQYITHLKNRDYKKVIECYTGIPSGAGTGYEHIKNALKNRYDGVYDMSIKSTEKSSESGSYKILFETRGDSGAFEDSVFLYNTSSSFFGLKKEWKVVFPFKTRDITIGSAEGAVVLIDGIESGEIKGGKLAVSQVIWGKHNFEVKLNGIAQSDNQNIKIDESTETLELKVIFSEEFRKSVDKLLSDFVKGWSDYCLTQNPEKVKSFLTDRLYKEYTKDSDRFNGSKYVISQCSLEHGELETGSLNAVSYTVDEKWHLKEVITSPEMVFKDNYKSQLEQTQHIKTKYQLVNDGGAWKIDSAKQLAFKQEIKK